MIRITMFVGSGKSYFPQMGMTMEGVIQHCLTRQGIDGYTVYRATGAWEGTFEDALVVDVVSAGSNAVEFDQVEAAASELIELTEEQSVLVVAVPVSAQSKFITKKKEEEWWPYSLDSECQDLQNSLKF